MNMKQLLATAAVLASFGAQAASFDLAGTDGTGYSALIGFKATTTQAAAEAWNYPYYQDANGIYRAIAATPLSPTNDYSAYLPAGTAVYGRDVTSADFATLSAGSVSYDETVLTGVGVETIGVDALNVVINAKGLSPFHNGYNTGSGFGDFGFNYDVTASNLTGTGLTFNNGVLSSVDLDADLGVSIRIAESTFYVTNLGTQVKAVLNGKLSISGDSYSFAVRDTGTYSFALQPAGLTLNFAINRAGSIDAVTAAVPEPSTYALMAAGLLMAGMRLRNRRRQG